MVIVLGCGRCIVVVELIREMTMMNDDLGHHSSFGCQVTKSDNMAPGSVVNNKLRDGDEDSLRMKTMNNHCSSFAMLRTAMWHLGFPCIVVASPHSLGDVALPHHLHGGGCGWQMWMVVASGDGDDYMTVAMRQQ